MTDSQTAKDVVDILTADHRDVVALLGEVRTVTDPMIKRDLTDTAISELVRHAVAEEMYVYPAMKKHLPDGEKAVEHDTQEHKEIEVALKKLEGADVASAEFASALQELDDLLADHIQDEENEQFPELRARIPREELVELAGKVETAKKLAPTRPHPGAPNSELFHKTVGAGVGLVDRLRDKISGRATK
ncbi:hemerythrin domain-containing protein [Actinoplanes sp. N902-109]|uniref:hemerythrin domain-containing protein n=1 Tax=Actinoplanes sp. (strain N902-109) TaxID=649831 RepID=UPI00032936F7|nr:hemerythrin domain-containing protein [Actinoplanes sp. N902-109]AGL17674.1 hemerythrin HHE cation binding domain-containing protein [Actinoplanes sp. N902-109]